jgi:putative oxidoreductase
MNFLRSLQPAGLLAVRLALGIIFISHGYPKLAGQGAAMQPFFIQHGLPGNLVYVAGVLEFFGGGLLILGLFTQVAALLLAMEMAVAIWKVHSGQGILAVHAYEFPLIMGTACLTLSTTGAGLLSVDHPLFGGGSHSKPSRRPKND